jgi:hypothetical protein
MKFLSLIFLLLLPTLASSDVRLGQLNFEDYQKKGTFGGAVSFPDFNGRDKWVRRYRTRITDGINSGINFAGQYAIIEIGCGTSCRHAYVVDLSNGEVFDFPYGGDEHYEMNLIYYPWSSLVQVQWRFQRDAVYNPDGEFLAKCIAQDLEWNGSDFQVLSEKSFETTGYCN